MEGPTSAVQELKAELLHRIGMLLDATIDAHSILADVEIEIGELKKLVDKL